MSESHTREQPLAVAPAESERTPQLGAGWLRVWLACVAFYYPSLWLSFSVSEAASALIRAAFFGYRLAWLRIFPVGVVARSVPPAGPANATHSHAWRSDPFSLVVPILFLLAAIVVLAVIGRNARTLSGLLVATLADVLLLPRLEDMFFARRISAEAVLASVILSSALCLGLRWMLIGWTGLGYWRRAGSLFAGFVLLPVIPWVALTLFSGFRFWGIPPWLTVPGAVAALSVSLRPARTDHAPRQPSWKPVGWGAAISLLLIVAVPLVGRALDRELAQKRAAANQAAMAAVPPIPLNLPYAKLFFQKGVNFTAEFPNRYDSEGARQLLRLLPQHGVNAIALVPYGWSSQKPPQVRIGGGPDTWESDEGVQQLSRLAHYLGVKVLLKPAIWEAYQIEFSSARDRATWFDQYRLFLEHYARLAKQIHADVFCVGGEFTHLTQYDADWRKLITRARELYPGPLVYAANFGTEFETLTFWDSLDYIGLQEYYPLPDDLSTDSVVQKVEAVQQRFQKPVIFTEGGFPSYEMPNREPWEDRQPRKVSLEAQARCYEVVLRAFYRKPWFQGVYWWKVGTNAEGGPGDSSLTPWGKPAMEVVKRWYMEGGR